MARNSSRNRHSTALHRLALAGALLALSSSAVWAQAASNVNCNKCVDTGDIAKKAVDKKKLAKGAVNSSRIADGAVKAKDLADGAVEESKLEDGAVTSGKIADGAVSAAKLAPDAVFGRIIVVRADPVDTIGNCDALQNVLAGITDNDADNRYLIHLEPGIYDCGATTVQMKTYVDLQGSGRNVTLVSGNVGSIGLIDGADNAELRHLTVENSDAAPSVIAIRVSNVAAFRVTNVTAIVRDTPIADGILVNSASAVVLTDVKVEVSNVATASRGVRLINDSSVELVNVTVGDVSGLLSPDTGMEAASFALSVAAAAARNSVFRGGDFALSFDGTAVGNIVSSQIDGGTDGVGTFVCVGTYDGAFAALGNDCDP